MINELIKIANELDERSLVKEADDLDRLIEQGLKAPTCAERAAIAMVDMADHVRETSLDPCEWISYPFDANDSIKADIVGELEDMRDNLAWNADGQVDKVLSDYIKDSRHSFSFLKEMSSAGGFIGSLVRMLGRGVIGDGVILGDAGGNLKEQLIDKPQAQRALNIGGPKVNRQGVQI
jgi:hypothetical protein